MDYQSYCLRRLPKPHSEKNAEGPPLNLTLPENQTQWINKVKTNNQAYTLSQLGKYNRILLDITTIIIFLNTIT